ncbi:TPA: hypothetical protein QC448_003185 [Bacillus cereus]|uniref:hypothetical protein n=1 Tax=Bacillus thuringiensis TaxID=1428 RepID=UPI000BF34709|nr:hypothetical protein [Bacillus thuringiensis]PFU74042.1 hypothetical protein COK95_01500 [Bacillus thuringiensis]HDR8128096.1 hypothetical protein [Bacillus cereus]HDR8492138.1 hypothetical protein [Bacillus cereus]
MKKQLATLTVGILLTMVFTSCSIQEGGTEETSSNTNEELIQFSGTEDLSKDEQKYINYVAKDTLDFQNTKSNIFDLMGNVVDNPNKLNDSTWKQEIKEHIKVSKKLASHFLSYKKVPKKLEDFHDTYVDAFKLDEEAMELLTNYINNAKSYDKEKISEIADLMKEALDKSEEANASLKDLTK